MTSRRDFLAAGGAAALHTWVSPPSPGSVRSPRSSAGEDQVRARRLSWAGVQLALPNSSLFIDPWITPSIWDGAWTEPTIPLGPVNDRSFVLVTHLHNDHFDPAAIASAIGERGVVACLDEVSTTVAARGFPGPFRLRAARLYEPLLLGDFTATPVPAVDGYHDTQCSWIVTVQGRRIFHGGDTLWHGAWWRIGRQLGPVDVAFLPINGAVIQRSPPSGMPAVMTPEQAVAAARLLGARLLVPIHYGLNIPGSYEEFPNVTASLISSAKQRGQPVQLVRPGDWVEWPAT